MQLQKDFSKYVEEASCDLESRRKLKWQTEPLYTVEVTKGSCV